MTESEQEELLRRKQQLEAVLQPSVAAHSDGDEIAVFVYVYAVHTCVCARVALRVRTLYGVPITEVHCSFKGMVFYRGLSPVEPLLPVLLEINAIFTASEKPVAFLKQECIPVSQPQEEKQDELA